MMKKGLLSLLFVALIPLFGSEIPKAENITCFFNDDGSAMVSWTTKTPALLMQVRVRGGGKTAIIPERETRPKCVRVHEALIPAAVAGNGTISINGENFQLKRPRRPGNAPLKVELSVSDPAAPRRAWRVVSGVPLAQGKLFDARKVMLTDDAGQLVEALIEPFTFWPDGSVQWLTLIFNADTECGKATRFFLVNGKASRCAKANDAGNFKKVRCKITFADNSAEMAEIGALKLRNSRILPGGMNTFSRAISRENTDLPWKFWCGRHPTA